METPTNSSISLGTHWWCSCFSLSLSDGVGREANFGCRSKSLSSSSFPPILNHILFLDLFVLHWFTLCWRDGFFSTFHVNPRKMWDDYWVPLNFAEEIVSLSSHAQHSCEGLLHHPLPAIVWEETCLISLLMLSSWNHAASSVIYKARWLESMNPRLLIAVKILLWESALTSFLIQFALGYFLEIYSHPTSSHRQIVTWLGWCYLTANLRFQRNVYLRSHFVCEVFSEL